MGDVYPLVTSTRVDTMVNTGRNPGKHGIEDIWRYTKEYPIKYPSILSKISYLWYLELLIVLRT